jgi:hypothetical protein
MIWNASYIVKASPMDFYPISFAVRKIFPWQAELAGTSHDTAFFLSRHKKGLLQPTLKV